MADDLLQHSLCVLFACVFASTVRFSRNNSGHVPCQRCVLWAGWVSSCYGGHSVEETPGSIPNPEAKPHCADGTALGRVWESRSPPDIFTGEWRSSRTPAGCSPPPLPFSHARKQNSTGRGRSRRRIMQLVVSLTSGSPVPRAGSSCR